MLTFTKSQISFTETGHFEKLLVDYVNDNDFLKNFYSFDDSVEGVMSRIESYKNPRLNRKNLTEAITRQYLNGGFPHLPETIIENLSLLEDEKTFTVSTGHQLNIFSGPLYVFYKLISVIKLARRCNELMPEYRFVPVYWMASEDHDMKEITSLKLFGHTINWNTTWKGVSGKAPLTDFKDVSQELTGLFESSPFQNDLTAIIDKSYGNSGNLAEATRKWVNELFGKYGLLVVDGSDALLKKQFSDVMSDELNQQTSSKLIHESTAELKHKYHLQVNPRDINLFYVGDDFRNRIVSEGGKFKVLNTSLEFNTDQISAELASHPERFSPNVILRPLYQETILPNVIYTGGPAEIAYWLELKSIFDNYDIPMPVLFMRSSATIVDHASSAMMTKYSLRIEDIFKPVDELIKNFILKDDSYSLERVTKILSEEMDKLSKDVSLLDPTLRSTVESEKQRISNSLHALEQKIVRAVKKKNEVDINRIRKLKDRLFPEGKLQEREVSGLSFLLNRGPEFLDALINNMDPLEKQFLILQEQKD